jgi:hypothetical protein
MSDKEYLIHAIWDAEAGVFYAESDVPGLNVEAATLPEFLEILQDVVPELLAANAGTKDATSGQPDGRLPRVRLETELAFA